MKTPVRNNNRLSPLSAEHADENGRRGPGNGRFNAVLLLCAGLLPGLALPAYGGVEINYAYDDLNQLRAMARSDGPAMVFQYDEVGNLIEQGATNSPDTDGDQIANFADPDDDDDGMPDAWETQYGFNPLNPVDAGVDADADGYTNLAEYQAKTDPLLAEYILRHRRPWRHLFKPITAP